MLSLRQGLESGSLVFVEEGRNDSLALFWKRPKHSKARIQAVEEGVDAGYICTVMESLEDADVDYDRSHVVKIMNDNMARIRHSIVS